MNCFWGGTPLSFMRYMTLRSFRYHNPDWEINLYQPPIACPPKNRYIHEQEDTGYAGEDYREQLDTIAVNQLTWLNTIPSISAAHASDLFQWELLSKQSGFYSDMDILYTRPIEPLYETIKEVATVFCLQGGGMSIGFHASIAPNPIYKHIYLTALNHQNNKRYQCTGVEAVYKAAEILHRRAQPTGTKAVKKFVYKFPDVPIATIPDQSFYSYDWVTYPKIFSQCKEVPSDVYGLHWFGGSPIAPDWGRKLTPQNLDKYGNTWCKYAKVCL